LSQAEHESAAARGSRLAAPHPVGLGRIFLAFLRLGGTAFGGGTAGWLYREIVLRRRWIDDATFLGLLAMVQIMPGSNGVNLTVLIGRELHGVAGAAAALIGLLTAPFAIVMAIGTVYGGLGEHAVIAQMLDGVAAMVIGLTFATGLGSLARSTTDPAAWLIASATVVAIGVLRWPLLPVVAAMIPVSIALALVRRHRR